MQQNQEYSSDNPMVRLAGLYKAVEHRLRRAATDNTPISMADLLADPEVNKFANSLSQLRDLVGRLVKTFYITSYGPKAAMKYAWNPDAPPFTLQTKTAQKAAKRPSKPRVTTQSEAKPEPKAHNPKEIEVVFEGMQIIIGKNPKTGRLRVVIEG